MVQEELEDDYYPEVIPENLFDEELDEFWEDLDQLLDIFIEEDYNGF